MNRIERKTIIEMVRDNMNISNCLGFSGDLANLRYYNRAINTDEVYSIYKKGPETVNMVRKLLPNISFKLSAEAGAEEDNE